MRLHAVVLAVVLTAGAYAAGSALATEGPTTEPTTVESTPSTTGATGQGSTGTSGATGSSTDNSEESSGQSSDSDLRFVAIAFIAFALLVIVAVLRYLNSALEQFYETSRLSMRRLGKVPPAESVDAFAGARLATESAEESLEIDGPAVLAVGVGSSFTAKLNGSEVSAAWSADPDSSGVTFDPSSAASTTTATASQAGKFKVIAEFKKADGTTVKSEVEVSAVVVSSESAKLPLIGVGYGTVVVAIVTVTAVATLGLLDILGKEALATFFGGVLGYIFVKGGQATSSGTQVTDQGTTPSAP